MPPSSVDPRPPCNSQFQRRWVSNERRAVGPFVVTVNGAQEERSLEDGNTMTPSESSSGREMEAEESRDEMEPEVCYWMAHKLGTRTLTECPVLPTAKSGALCYCWTSQRRSLNFRLAGPLRHAPEVAQKRDGRTRFCSDLGSVCIRRRYC